MHSVFKNFMVIIWLTAYGKQFSQVKTMHAMLVQHDRKFVAKACNYS